MPSDASPGALKLVSKARSGVSSVSALLARLSDRAAQVRRGLGRLRWILAGARADRDAAVRRGLEHHNDVAPERLVEHLRGRLEQRRKRLGPEGERAERADGGMLHKAAIGVFVDAHALGDVLGDHDRPDHAGLRPQRCEVQPVVALAVGRAVERPALRRQCRAPELADPRPRARGDHVGQVTAHRQARIDAMALVDVAAHEDDPQIGVDDHHAAVGQEVEKRVGELRRVAEPAELVQRRTQHQDAIPISGASARLGTGTIPRSADLQ